MNNLMFFVDWNHPGMIALGVLITVGALLAFKYLVIDRQRRKRAAKALERQIAIIPPPDLATFVHGSLTPKGVKLAHQSPWVATDYEWQSGIAESGAEILAAITAAAVSNEGVPYRPLDFGHPYFYLIEDIAFSPSGKPVLKVRSDGNWPDFEQRDEDGSVFIPVAGIAYVDGRVLNQPIIFLPYIHAGIRTEENRLYGIEMHRNEREHNEAWRNDRGYYALTSMVHKHPIFPKPGQAVGESALMQLRALPESGELYICVHGVEGGVPVDVPLPEFK
ncbi:MAG TPA: hypothetical protein VMM38_01385 [Aridibacter sp.]|nr:hypothetical protein [Aridibacter sp.]